jgi:dihydroorotase
MTMMNRRQFVYAAAAGAAMLPRPIDALAAAANYDLIIKGGRVIDPSMRLDAIRDVAIAGNRIAAVEANITAATAETIDASGTRGRFGPAASRSRVSTVRTHAGGEGDNDARQSIA